MPPPYTFTRADGGFVYFFEGVTLRTPGFQELYAYDTATYKVWGYAVYAVGGGSRPSGRSGGRDAAGQLAGRTESGRAPAVPDLFAGQELLRDPGRPIHRPATPEAVPSVGLRQVEPGAVPSVAHVPPVGTAETHSAARLDRSGAVRQPILDYLFANLDEHRLTV